MSRSLRVERAGFTTLQDLGRPGWAHLGVPHSGAADRTSHALANRLAGNAATAATLETSGGLVVRAEHDMVVVLTGADCDAFVDGTPLARCRATRVAAGKVIRVERMRVGVRSYLAIAGGIDGTVMLGSQSHDTLSSIVPQPLTDGVALHIGAAQRDHYSLDVPIEPTRRASVRLSRGPHAELIADATLRHVTTAMWSVSEASNRVGVRLTATETNMASQNSLLGGQLLGELDSMALVRGAVQLTPSGELVVMLADHPTTGGYPVMAVVHAEDVDSMGQYEPTSSVRFLLVEESNEYG